ncbi:unnamed protein product [Musa acuminata var. zebrina]
MDCLSRSILADHNASVRSACLRIPAVNTTLAIFHKWGLGNDSRNSTMGMPNQVAQPQLIVLEGVGGDGVGAAEWRRRKGAQRAMGPQLTCWSLASICLLRRFPSAKVAMLSDAQVGEPQDNPQQCF